MEENINPIKNEIKSGEINPDETKQILRQQTELLAQIARDIRSMKRAAAMSKIINLVIFVLFFVAPVILSVLYLPTLINNFSSILGGLYGGGSANIDPMKILSDPNYLKQIQGQINK